MVGALVCAIAVMAIPVSVASAKKAAAATADTSAAAADTTATDSSLGLVNNVTGVQTSLEVPFPTFVYLAGKHISAYPGAPATLSFQPGPRIFINFPIVGGTLVGNTNIGTINMKGDLTMVKSSEDYSTTLKSLRSSDLTILNGANVVASAHALDGTPVIGDIGAPAPVMDLQNVVRTDTGPNSFTLSADYVVNAVTATVLNTYFDTDAFTAGFVLGHGVSTVTTSSVL
jgi:hypothetical protein